MLVIQQKKSIQSNTQYNHETHERIVKKSYQAYLKNFLRIGNRVVYDEHT